MKQCKAVIVHSTFPGMISIRGPRGKGQDDSIRDRLSEAGFVPGERVVVVLESDLRDLEEQAWKYAELAK